MKIDFLGIIGFFIKNKPILISKYNFTTQKILYLIIHSTFFNFFVLYLRYHSLLFTSIGVEISSSENNLKYFNKTIYYYFYLTKFKIKLGLILLHNINNSMFSIEKYYQNLSWGERELAEMWNINFKNKIDNRILLLDYSFTGFPLEKTYPVTGYQELFFDISSGNILFTNINLEEEEFFINDNKF